jgi:hypothetical protein
MSTPRPAMFRAGAVPGAAPQFAPAASGPSVLLADISEFQPDIADAAYLAWSKGVVIRALYGTTADRAWYGGARRADLHAGGAKFVGIYGYLVAGQDAAAQARALVSLVGNLRLGEKLICDIEEGPAGAQAARWRQWSAVITAAYGRAADPWLYAGESFAGSAGLDPQWEAAYRATEPGGGHLLWQFTDAYPVPGVGTADCSVFHGTVAQLAAHGWQAAPVEPPVPWVFTAVRGLKAVPGHTSVLLSWSSPADPAPVPVGHYQVTIRKDGEDVASYPRDVAKVGSAQSWQGGSLEPGTTYEVLVRAVTADVNGHASPWAAVAFTTGHG